MQHTTDPTSACIFQIRNYRVAGSGLKAERQGLVFLPLAHQ
jgi:hypothetical protein